MPTPSDIPNSKHASEVSKSLQTYHRNSPISDESADRLRIPKQSLKHHGSVESLSSKSDISDGSFGFNEPSHGHDRGLIRRISDVSTDLTNITDPSTWKSKLQEFWVVNYGAFLVLLSQVFGATMSVSTRLLEIPGAHGEPMHPFQILFARQSITTLITTVYALWSKSIPDFPFGPPGTVRLLLISRGFCGFLGVFGMYFSLLYLPISEATILTFLSPIGSCIAFSLLLPGETFSRQQMLAGLVSLLGVVFIARPVSLFQGHDASSMIPQLNNTMVANGTLTGSEVSAAPQPTQAQHLQAIGVAMIGVVGAIGAITSIRAIGQRAHALLSVNYFSAWCTFVSLFALLMIPTVKFRLPSNSLEWGLLLILGLAGFIMQLLLTKGMAYGGAPAIPKATQTTGSSDLEMQPHTVLPPTSLPGEVKKGVPKNKSSGAKATSMLYTQMLFALISDKVFFGITPNLWSWIGSGLILFGAIWVAADTGQKSTTTKSDRVTPPIHQNAATRKQTSDQEELGLLSNFEDGSSQDRSGEWTPRTSLDR